jgi:hypothetical protein
MFTQAKPGSGGCDGTAIQPCIVDRASRANRVRVPHPSARSSSCTVGRLRIFGNLFGCLTIAKCGS